MRLRAAALGGGAARRDHLLAERLLAARLPREREGSPRPGARRTCATQGYITPGGVRRVRRRSRSPTTKDLTPPAENSAAPYFTSWLRQQLVDRYGAGEAFGGGLQIKLDPRPRAPEPGRGRSSSRPLAGIEPTASVGRARQRDRPASWRWSAAPTIEDAPFNLATNGHRQPGLGVQAVHPDHRARAGPLDRRGLHLGAAGDPVPGQGAEEERQGRQGRRRALQGQQLRRLLPRLGLDRDRDHLLRQLGLLAARHPGRARERRRDGGRDGDRDRPLDRDSSTRSTTAPSTPTTRR